MAELLEEYKMVIGELTMSRQTMENIMAGMSKCVYKNANSSIFFWLLRKYKANDN